MRPEELFTNLSPSVFVIQTLNADRKLIAFGSGVVVNYDHVATNKHVVSGGVTFLVKHGNQTWPASITHLDPRHDICQLKVENLGAPPLSLRDYSGLVVGERVYALGAPEGFDLTLSEGLISGLRRRGGTNVIQTTAPISHGSSGGGLFDLEGRLVGITTYYIEDGQSLNFAIAAELASSLVQYPFTEQPKPFEEEQGAKLSEMEELASQKVKEGKYGEALKLYRELLSIKPEDPNIWQLLGMCYCFVSLFEDSIDACHEALRLKPDFAHAWHWLGKACAEIKQFDKAIEAFKKVIKLDPNDFYAWLDLGDTYRHIRANNEALASYKEAARLKPKEASPWEKMGRLHLEGNKYTEAVAALLEAIRHEPDEPWNWYFLGVAYHHQRDLEKKLQVLSRLEQLDPKKARDFARTYVR